MRKNLFRGKRIDNGEWVYWDAFGRFTTKGGKGARMVVKTDCSVSTYYLISQRFDLLDKNTVGQYIGKKDKNRKKIFEGDIFEWGYAGVKEFRYMVVYDADVASFVGERHFGFVSLNGIDIEIIGNIHDNPELLGGAE
jgi:uncharacterized phage protein (TIGR01671 family)